MTSVTISNLAKTYPGRPPVEALRGVDLTIESGSVVAVLGPSGCGKTTLLRLIAGFERPDRGDIVIGDLVVSADGTYLPPERRNVGVVPQEGALFPHLDVAGNVGFGLRSLDRNERAARVAELLEMVGLGGYQRRRPHELSGGQQQRVAIARALAPRPAVVLLDEPFTALDAGLRTRLRADVAALLRQQRATAVLVTHDPAEAMGTASLVAVIRDGRFAQIAPSREIYSHPADVATALMLGEAVVLPATASHRTASCRLGQVALDHTRATVEGAATLLLRPEQIVPDAESPVRAVIRALDFQGHDAVVDLDFGDLVVPARWSSVDVAPVGETVGIRIVGFGVLVDSEGTALT